MPNPWSTPTDWVTGQTVTEAQLDRVSANDLAVGAHILAQYEATANVATIDLTQIPVSGVYHSLQMRVAGRVSGAINTGVIGVQFSAGTSSSPTFDTATNYAFNHTFSIGAGATAGVAFGSSYMLGGVLPGSSAPAGYVGQFTSEINGCRNPAQHKVCQSQYTAKWGTTAATDIQTGNVGGHWHSTAGIGAIRLVPITGTNILTGTTVLLVGYRSTSTST